MPNLNIDATIPSFDGLPPQEASPRRRSSPAHGWQAAGQRWRRLRHVIKRIAHGRFRVQDGMRESPAPPLPVNQCIGHGPRKRMPHSHIGVHGCDRGTLKAQGSQSGSTFHDESRPCGGACLRKLA